MMTDIFSSFDPNTNLMNSHLSSTMFWMCIISFMCILNSMFWMQTSRFQTSFYAPMDLMVTQSTRTFSPNLKSLPHILVSLFILLIMINLMGILPYMFSASSHLLFTMSLGLPLWLSLIISGAIFAPNKFTAHFLPSGAPDWLNPFLVIIESISTMARPITLSFRLAANMSAGHIVLTLIGIYISSSLFMSMTNSMILIMIQMMYMMFELGICMIQAYIFCLLLSLYSNDHPSMLMSP